MTHPHDYPEWRAFREAHIERLSAMFPMLEAAGIGIVDGDAHPCEEFIRHRANDTEAQGRAAPVITP